MPPAFKCYLCPSDHTTYNAHQLTAHLIEKHQFPQKRFLQAKIRVKNTLRRVILHEMTTCPIGACNAGPQEFSQQRLIAHVQKEDHKQSEVFNQAMDKGDYFWWPVKFYKNRPEEEQISSAFTDPDKKEAALARIFQSPEAILDPMDGADVDITGAYDNDDNNYEFDYAHEEIVQDTTDTWVGSHAQSQIDELGSPPLPPDDGVGEPYGEGPTPIRLAGGYADDRSQGPSLDRSEALTYNTLHGPHCSGRKGDGNIVLCLTAPCQGVHEYQGVLNWEQHCMTRHSSIVLSTSRRERNLTKLQDLPRPQIQPVKAPRKRKVRKSTMLEPQNTFDPSRETTDTHLATVPATPSIPTRVAREHGTAPSPSSHEPPSDDATLHYGECLAVQLGTGGFRCGTGPCAYAAFSLERWHTHCIDMHGEPEDTLLRASFLKRKADIATPTDSGESRKRPRLAKERAQDPSLDEAAYDVDEMDMSESSESEGPPSPVVRGFAKKLKFPGPEKGYPERIYKPVYPPNEQLAQRFCLYPDLKVGVCIPCGVTMHHQKIHQHLRSVHPLPGKYTLPVQAEIDEFIRTTAGDWGAPCPPKPWFWWCRPPVHINVVDATRCQLCGFVMVASISPKNRHACSSERMHGRRVLQSVRAFKWCLTSDYIPVTPFHIDARGVQANSALDDLFKYTDDLGLITDSGEYACDLDPFNDKCGFSAFKATLGDSEKEAMRTYAKGRLSNQRFKEYVNHLDDITRTLQAVLDVRVELRSTMATIGERTQHDSLRKIQDPRRYIRHAVAFLLFVLDTWKLRPSERHYFITQKHRKALQAFEVADHAAQLNLLTHMLRVFWLDSLYQSNGDIEAMQTGEGSNSTLGERTHNRPADPRWQRASVEEVYDNGNHAAYAEGNQPSDEEEDDEGSADDFMDGGSGSGSDIDSDDDAIDAEMSSNEWGEGAGGTSVRQSFKNAYTAPPQTQTQSAPAYHPFQVWIMLFNMEGPNFRADAKKVTACLSSFQWVARMVAFEEGLLKSNNKELDNAHLLKQNLENITHLWLSEGKTTIFSWARWLVHESTRHSNRVAGLGTIYDLSETSFSVSGRTIHVPAFQAMVAELMKETEVAFDNLLTHWGVTVDDLEIPSCFEDRVDSRGQGQWFGRLEFQTQATKDMITATKGRIRACMLANGSLLIQDHQTWSPDKISAMVDATSRFMQHLQATCASVGGQPSRINELSELRFVTGNRERNLYDFDGDMVFCTKYDKTTWLSGFDKLIPHVYPARLSVILRRYLVYVRPLEYRLGALCVIADEEKLSICRYKLFSFFGKSLGTSHFSDFIMEFTASKLVLEPGLRVLDFRHTLVHICRRYILKEAKIKRMQDIADFQAGHTPATATKVYAIPLRPCPSDPRYYLEFRDLCYRHHEFFKLRTVDDEVNLETFIERLGDQSLKKVELCVENALKTFMANVKKSLDAEIAAVVGREMEKAFKSLGRR